MQLTVTFLAQRPEPLVDPGELTERLTEEELDQFFNLSVDMFCVFGFDGCFRLVNPACERTLGYTRDELLRLTTRAGGLPRSQRASRNA